MQLSSWYTMNDHYMNSKTYITGIVVCVDIPSGKIVLFDSIFLFVYCTDTYNLVSINSMCPFIIK